MDMNRLITMISRIFMRRMINTGIDYATRRGKSKPTNTTAPQDRAHQSQERGARELAKNARKAARITRRLGR